MNRLTKVDFIGLLNGISLEQSSDRQVIRKSVMVFLLGCLLVHALAGCGGNGSGSAPLRMPPAQPPPAQAPPAAQDARQGSYIGTVTIGGVDYYSSALITADGLVRLYIGGPNSSDGVVQGSIHTASAQLFGPLAQPNNDPDGADLIFGQGCSAPWVAPMIFCGAAGHANPNMAIVSGNIQGEILVTMPGPGGFERDTWTLELGPWANSYDQPATLGALAGQYKEVLADFAQNGDTIINIDADGKISFQSAGSGCTGNGGLESHLDGAVNVYDVVLTISGCQPPFDYLNADFYGLATTGPSTVWENDVLLQMWLTQTNPDIWDYSPPALTMSGRLLAGS